MTDSTKTMNVEALERETNTFTTPDIPLTIIQPSKGWVSLQLHELWTYRELVYFLTWRDIKVRYKQAALGVSWAIIQPLLTMVIFSVIFGQLAKLPSDGIPYPLFSYAALLPWNLFSSALTRAGISLVGNSNLLTKVYFPRLSIPLSAVAAGLVDLAISLIVLFGLMLYYGVNPTWIVLTLPLFVMLALATAFAVGLWLSALNVQYRDVQHMIPFLIQAWMYASPVAYSAGLVPTGFWRIIYGLNPMAGVIQGFRWALLGTTPPDELMIASVVMVIVLLVTGLFYFRRMEKTFADIV
jgi:lipopolysaccharide transport system permease protein